MTNEVILHLKKKKLPPKFIYSVLGGLWKILFLKKYGVKYTFNYDFRKEKGPYFLISNHTSRVDYVFAGLPAMPAKFNFVVGYNEFFRSHLRGVFDLLQIIPKKNFVPDIYTVKEINRIISKGGKIMIFPEGMSSIGGMNQPVATGTGKLLKHYKIPVYYSVIRGGYLTTPKYSLDDRFGTVEVTFDRMFTPEDLEKLSPEEIEDVVNDKLWHDDYKWNKEKKYVYKNNGKIAENLHQLLYKCPKCHAEFTMKGEGNTIKCLACGNGATISDTYEMTPFNDDCVIPATQSEWFNMQREAAKEEIKDPDFKLIENVKLGLLPEKGLLKDQKTSEIRGSGVLTLNKTGLKFDGEKDGAPYSFFIPVSELPTYGMCTDVSRFYTFVDGKFHEFYPERDIVEKFFLATEELHRAAGGKWRDFKFPKNR